MIGEWTGKTADGDAKATGMDITSTDAWAADKSRSGTGAVELTARFSVTNFASDNLPPVPNASGGGSKQPETILYDATLGVNWYLNDFTRLMFNYTMTIPDIQAQSALPVHTFGLRTAVFW